MVELRLLEVFCVAVESRSFTAAAERLGISQPAVSKQVRAFESWCGARLLERSRGGVKPTREGQQVYTEGRGLLAEAERFGEEVSGLSSSGARRLRISASYTIGEYLLPGWIDAFQHQVPEVVTELVVGNSEAALKEFTSGGTDLCFIESGHDAEGGDAAPDLARVPVAWDRLVLAVAPKHRWAAREGVEARELLEEPFISREPGSGTRVVAERAFREAGLAPPEPAMELASTGSIKRTLAAGHGYALLSGYVIRDELSRGELVSPETASLDLRRSLDLVRPPGRPLSPLAESFLETIGSYHGRTRSM
jgi:DNA-binding transcriptional LysR family regulator